MNFSLKIALCQSHYFSNFRHLNLFNYFSLYSLTSTCYSSLMPILLFSLNYKNKQQNTIIMQMLHPSWFSPAVLRNINITNKYIYCNLVSCFVSVSTWPCFSYTFKIFCLGITCILYHVITFFLK